MKVKAYKSNGATFLEVDGRIVIRIDHEPLRIVVGDKDLLPDDREEVYAPPDLTTAAKTIFGTLAVLNWLDLAFQNYPDEYIPSSWARKKDVQGRLDEWPAWEITLRPLSKD